VICTLEEFLFQLSLGDFDLDCLVNLICMASLVVLIVLDGCGKEGVDEGSLAQARFAGHLARW
jgi:hypothetical protein